MKKIIFTFLIFITTLSCFCQAYEYRVKIKGMEDTVIYFGHHFGEKQYVIDTCKTDADGLAIISGDKKLTGGIYLIIMPKLKNRFFEIIINEPSFSIETDTMDFTKLMHSKNSFENTLFYQDLNFISLKRKESDLIKEKIKQTDESNNEIIELKEQLKKINIEVENERKQIQTNYPNTFYAKFLFALEEIKVPDTPVLENGKKDSLFAYWYIREHYFDHVDFSDERFLRSNIFYPKIKRYISDFVPRDPDSISIALDKIIQKTEANNEVFKYILVTLLNEYANSKIMGMDAVYVYLVDNYYAKGKAYWIDDVSLYKIKTQAEKLRNILIGKQAPFIIMQDTLGNDIPLYSIEKKYTIVVFWSPDCSHCKKEMPKLEAIYSEIKLRDAEIYAVYSEEEWDKWKKWLKEHPYSWINVGNLDLKSNYQVMYNVDVTPMIFILNEKKEIIAKKIGVDQVLEILDAYEKMNSVEK